MMRRFASQFWRLVTRLVRREDGAVLVEFALVFPVMLLFFAVIVEGSRLMWSYQMAIEGVRDAGRYLARIAPVDVCDGGTMPDYTSVLLAMVQSDLDADAIFPPLVTVNSVTHSHACVSGSYRTDPAPVATVTADMTITFPLGAIFGLFGASLTSATTTVSDSARIFGQ